MGQHIVQRIVVHRSAGAEYAVAIFQQRWIKCDIILGIFVDQRLFLLEYDQISAQAFHSFNQGPEQAYHPNSLTFFDVQQSQGIGCKVQ